MKFDIQTKYIDKINKSCYIEIDVLQGGNCSKGILHFEL